MSDHTARADSVSAWRHRWSRAAGTAVLASGLLLVACPLVLPASAATAGAHSPHKAPAAVATPYPTAKPLPVPTFSGPPPFAQYREIHANCKPTHHLADDPIVYPGIPGAAHFHTFAGNTTTNAKSTRTSLLAGKSSCEDTKDKSAYWIPTLYQNGKIVNPTIVTTYYKSGVKDYRTVQPFPAGFRLIVGDMRTPSPAAFQGNWTCGGNTFNDFPKSCPSGSSLIVRLKAPSCWNGRDLDSADHKSHMAYPVKSVCPAAFPIPLPMLEIKVPYKLPGGKTDGLAYSSGASYSFHYDFMEAWEGDRQAELVKHCINGGRQCNGYGIDKHKP
ncbi:hypothetical protein Aph01nite_71700 [Acrocarpospora phusangensis]|uniref:DUF1996 domain-containing protein n=1 Tax=Acrocarpospora phusangensis TaxID=1070424 RepID=A0A919QK09_9ACTN|nr:DUF1996 domain-containing protein [Acrocarpospora phusangensis]GIH28860.1 hypothetical protein Aph01nite_71700 [Acrocarpospora phusangensis]